MLYLKSLLFDGERLHALLCENICNCHASVSLSVCSLISTMLQIEDCRTRYNGDADHHQRRKKFTFPARLFCGDCYEVTKPSFLIP